MVQQVVPESNLTDMDTSTEDFRKILRHYTTPGRDVYSEVDWVYRSTTITNPDGTVVFEKKDILVPSTWSQLATDIIVSKYFKKNENSVKQVVKRLSSALRRSGVRQGYFASDEDAQAFEDEIAYMLLHQIGAFNSPVWFNLGVHEMWGTAGSTGMFGWLEEAGQVHAVPDSMVRPQCSACFIQSVDDDLMGIYELLKNEAKLFKYGSGTGSNFSSLRAKHEALSSGGTSSGLLLFLEVFDRAAGSTKSGGTTRRAAKMVTLDVDHPEIVEFIEWKAKEEKKARALIAQGYDRDFNGEAYHTISGQNSNNSVRVTDEFMQAVVDKGVWSTKKRTTGEVVTVMRARDLWDKIIDSAWQCADPGIQFDTTVNQWHTCPNSDRINASNPCSEYMFIDDSACNLASLNLVKFLNEDNTFDVESFQHAVRTFFLAQEILVDHSSYPTEKIAVNSHRFRPLGIGYANLGSMLTLMGMSYDSVDGRETAAAITAIMTGEAYAQSARMAQFKGSFDEYRNNKQGVQSVIEKHRNYAYQLHTSRADMRLVLAARNAWDLAQALGNTYGYRNAQVSLLAPTGTIGLLMDCDTTGIEPDFALVKFKKLAGGGYFKIVNQSVAESLRRTGEYEEDQLQAIVDYVQGSLTLDDEAPANAGCPITDATLLPFLGKAEIKKVQEALPAAFDLPSAFAPWVIGRDIYELRGLDPDKASGVDLLHDMLFNDDQIALAGNILVGRMTIEGAPFLKEKHLPIFDCANRCGCGTRYLKPKAHLDMMSAVQPFLSGAISKTVNMPQESTREDISEIYMQAWKAGLKAVAIYRDGSKAAQPLSTGKDKETKEESIESVPPQNKPAPKQTPSERVRLPARRGGFTQEAKVGGHKIYMRTGEYSDGKLGEIFLDIHKEGAAFRSLISVFSMAVSIGLQHGVPLSTYVEQFTFTRFEPQGLVEGHPNIKFATSIIDYIFRVLGVEYLKRYDLAQVKPEDK